MKRLLLTSVLAVMTVMAAMAQQKAPEGFSVIEEQPEGELRIYSRAGMTVSEDRETAEISTAEQSGTVNIVFGTDGAVYIQRPVSDSYYDGWVRCTLSADGKTLTMPMGQYTAYTRSFDMAVQVWVMHYDDGQQTYVADQSVQELTYTIGEDGVITQQGTDEGHFLGVVNRCFGDAFSYLDFEWHGFGDYATVYTPYGESNILPPASLQTETVIATTGYYDGMGWDVFTANMQMGFDGGDVWLQGITPLLPKAWVKGTRSGDTLTFPSGQVLGSYYSSIVYLVGAVPDEEGEPLVSDIVFTADGEGVYTSYTDIFINTSREDINFVSYYMGLTLTDKAFQPLEAPQGLAFEDYIMDYEEPDEDGVLRSGSTSVAVGTVKESVYIQGFTPILPNSVIKGEKGSDGTVTFPSPQFLGTYRDETGNYPIFFQAFDGGTGQLHPSVTFSFDASTGLLTLPSATIGIGINRTGLLLLQSFYDTRFTPSTAVGVTSAQAPLAPAARYNLQGQRVERTAKGMYIVNGKKHIR